MSNILEKYILLVFCSFVYSVAVTFNVDMQEQYLNGGSVYLAGADSLTLSSFGSIDTMQVDPWDPSGVIMQDDDLDGVFSVTVELPSTYECVCECYSERSSARFALSGVRPFFSI